MNLPSSTRVVVSSSVLALASWGTSASAVTIVDWDLSGASGNQLAQPASSAAPNITGGSIVRGSGLGVATATGSISSNGWEGAASGAVGEEYFSFGFTVAPGYTVDLDWLYLGTRASAAGPGTLGLFYSGDAYAASLFTFDQAATTGGTGELHSAIDLHALTGLTGEVTFRIYEIGNTQADGVGDTAGSGTFRLSNYVSNGGTLNMQVTGTVSAVPEPERYALLLVGLGLVGWRLCGRRSAH